MSIKIYVNGKENDCMLEEHGYWFRILHTKEFRDIGNNFFILI